MIKLSRKDVRIRSATRRWSQKTKEIARKIRKKQNDKNNLNKRIANIHSHLQNKNYNQYDNNYLAVQNNLEKLTKKQVKSKSKRTKNNLLAQINKYKKQRANYSMKMREISNRNGFGIWHNRLKRSRRNLKGMNKLLSSLEHQKSYAKSQYNNYKFKFTINRRNEIEHQNAPLIRNKIKKYRKNYTTLYRTDMLSSVVFALVEVSPNEVDTNTLDSSAIDSKDITQTNFVTRDSKEYSATFNLYGKNLRDCDNKFNLLQNWASKYEFTVNGFSRWRHAYITSVSKSTDITMNANCISLSITFNYAQQAKIQYAKRGKKRKAATRKRHGSNNSKVRYITIKPNMTYYKIAKKTNMSVSSLMKMNKYSATKLPIGKKIRYK
ncbi:LysM peptidoglycan-binding domain-containing protein [Apilactobacillus micheneri]|uniref:LysM peptidoglycan-binding domain-containing protein n=1 Tax=Apilactobacillus micheneri TaxID=1899430 RepID=A0ABY2YV10_9LACO|nr:LysM peptidoglycan-binding domain-containing protein [Apilactobacillus micheneri]TPR23132.1 LysM peptidoglycan-binding domain-containing protein [Apilactobacillus micheneri]TPR24450.1 LysM peptidoglycan-binding domain-containing protein [Apilactobacillus micheneri]TPR29397.1 LysM peptidoglycan-binding domain-containing protein [Apilactobacillus micheneri]TPR34604.1 LysM peptidoglycan-binding domain-containing protein [Apilactobacillus micheneri]